METQELVPHPPSRQDASAVVSVLVEIVGELDLERLRPRAEDDFGGPDLAERLRWRLARAGLVPPDADAPQVALAIDNLSKRMRYVLGDYKAPPEPDIGLMDHDVWFWSSRSRAAFLRDVDATGLRGRALRRWLRARAVGTTTELLGSTEFDRRVEQIEELARIHGGHYDGCSGPGTLPPQ